MPPWNSRVTRYGYQSPGRDLAEVFAPTEARRHGRTPGVDEGRQADRDVVAIGREVQDQPSVGVVSPARSRRRIVMQGWPLTSVVPQ